MTKGALVAEAYIARTKQRIERIASFEEWSREQDQIEGSPEFLALRLGEKIEVRDALQEAAERLREAVVTI